ncbi:nucleoside triphosphate pyrophosphohydrolase [Nitrospira sp. BLG_1]|uniref:nucleoside triphosphate pyrophosphohydrolase n=1 Tax=Nitrospira sp. BLG_1 TaxID=3395883 RepID=UPI0039BC2ECF
MSTRFDKVVEVMATLRAEQGCPWDRKQTHESLKPYLLEETYEVLETIDQRDPRKLQEELGDVLLQVLFHSQIATESHTFSIEDVLETLATKLIRRHPHVFTPHSEQERVSSSEQVLTQWEDIKRTERTADGKTQSALEGVPKTLPALLRAYQVQARAARVGFDWPHNAAGLEQVFSKITEEMAELHDAQTQHQASSDSSATESSRYKQVEAELGDVLFSLVNLARFLNVNPEEALRGTINRFTDRFHLVEAQAAEQGRSLPNMTLAEMDLLWEKAKQRLQPETATPKKDIHS